MGKDNERKTNLFTGATAVKVQTEAKKKGKEKREIKLSPNLDILSAIRAVKDQLATVEADYNELVKEEMMQNFVVLTYDHKQRPDNFRGIGNVSEASCELRVRSSRSPLSSEEMEVLDSLKVSYGEEITKDEIPEQFFFNPKLIMNEKIAQKISTALTSIPELRGKEIIFKQEFQPAEKKMVVTEKSFEDASKLKPELIERAYKIIATLAIKPTMQEGKGATLKGMMEILKEEGIDL